MTCTTCWELTKMLWIEGVVLAGPRRQDVGLAGGLVVLVPDEIHEEIALDEGVTFEVQGVVGAAQEDVVADVRDGFRRGGPVEVDGVVVAFVGAEDVLFDEEPAAVGDARAPDILAHIVRGRRLAWVRRCPRSGNAERSGSNSSSECGAGRSGRTRRTPAADATAASRSCRHSVRAYSSRAWRIRLSSIVWSNCRPSQ